MTFPELYTHYDTKLNEWLKQWGLSYKITQVAIHSSHETWHISYKIFNDSYTFFGEFTTIKQEFPDQWEIVVDPKNNTALSVLLNMADTMPKITILSYLFSYLEGAGSDILKFIRTENLSAGMPWVYHGYEACKETELKFKKLFKNGEKYLEALKGLEEIIAGELPIPPITS